MAENEKKKLLIAVLQESDYDATVEALTQHHFFVTKLSSSGGFLKKKNVTIMIGVDAGGVEQVLEILRSYAGRRRETVYTTMSSPSPDHHSTMPAIPIQMNTGGATVFVMDLDSLEKF